MYILIETSQLDLNEGFFESLKEIFKNQSEEWLLQTIKAFNESLSENQSAQIIYYFKEGLIKNYLSFGSLEVSENNTALNNENTLNLIELLYLNRNNINDLKCVNDYWNSELFVIINGIKIKYKGIN